VWAERARSDAVVVGGSTVRRDNPNLTTRRKDGHLPARVVLSRTMDLPGVEEENYGLGTYDTQDDGDDGEMAAAREEKRRKPRTNLWDTSEAPTIVMTRTGARPEFQAQLRELGVEVIEFDDLTPSAVAEYCGKRGYLQLFWECGGGLAAPALNDGVIHHVMAFIAPKIIGSSGGPAPSPVGETGLDLMTDAMTLRGLALSTHGRDVLLSGYLPAVNTSGRLKRDGDGDGDGDGFAGAGAKEEADPWTEDPIAVVERAASAMRASDAEEVRFYKSWDRYGALSNFSPHSIVAPKSWRGVDAVDGDDEDVEWPTVEHFYQAQKFSGVDAPAARDAMERIRAAASPEEAARIGRTSQKHCPELIRADWAAQKEGVMRAALRAKLSGHDAPRALLVGTKGKDVLEDSPHDAIWGVGRDGGGGNLLGKMLVELRDELTR
jgi:diaminohydroxyphosphoribosylaminopyrimidine deaminase/5-amino-6-(5-phosphoribosylamino)uracil reductase